MSHDLTISITVATDAIAKAVSSFLHGRRPSVSYIQFEKQEVVLRFEWDQLCIMARVPVLSEAGQASQQCFIASPELFDEFLRDPPGTIVTMSVQPDEAPAKGFILAIDVGETEVRWPVFSAEPIVVKFEPEGDAVSPLDIAQGIKWVYGFFDKNANRKGSQSDGLSLGVSSVQAGSAGSARQVEGHFKLPFGIFLLQSNAASLVGALAALDPAKARIRKDRDKCIFSDGRFVCSFPAGTARNTGLPELDFDVSVDATKLRDAASCALIQGGRARNKRYDLCIEQDGESLFLVFEVPLPGITPVPGMRSQKETSARVKCPVTPFQTKLHDQRLHKWNATLHSNMICAVGDLESQTIDIALLNNIAFDERKDSTTIRTRLSCRYTTENTTKVNR